MTSPAEEEELDYDEDAGDQFLDDVPLEEVDCDYDEEDAEVGGSPAAEDVTSDEGENEANSDGETAESNAGSEDEESSKDQQPQTEEENSDENEERTEGDSSDDEVSEDEADEADSGDDGSENDREGGGTEVAGSGDEQSDEVHHSDGDGDYLNGGRDHDDSAGEPRRKRRRPMEEERNGPRGRESRASQISEEEKKRRRAERFGLDGGHSGRASSGSTSSQRRHPYDNGSYETAGFDGRGAQRSALQHFSHASTRGHQSSFTRGLASGSHASSQVPLAARVGFRGKATTRGKNVSAQHRPTYVNPNDRPAVRPHPGLLPLPSTSPRSLCSERADGCESPTYGRRTSRAASGSRSHSREERDPRDSRPPHIPARGSSRPIQLARRGSSRKVRYSAARMAVHQDAEGPRSPSPQLRDVTPVPEALTVDTRQAKHIAADCPESPVKKQKPTIIGAGFKPTRAPVAPSEGPDPENAPSAKAANAKNDRPQSPSSLQSASALHSVTTRNDLREPLAVFPKHKNLTSTAVLEPSTDPAWLLRPIDLSDFVVYSSIAEGRPELRAHLSERRIPLFCVNSLPIDKAKDSLLKEFELAQWECHQMQVRMANYDAQKAEISRLEGEVAHSLRKNQQLQKQLADSALDTKSQKDLTEASVKLSATLKDQLKSQDALLEAEKTKTTQLSKELEAKRASYKELKKKLRHPTRASGTEVGIQTDQVDDDDVQEVHYEIPRNVTTELNDLRSRVASVITERDRLSKRLEEQKAEYEDELVTANKTIADLQTQLNDKDAELRAGQSACDVWKQKVSDGQRNVGALTEVVKTRGHLLRQRVCLRCAPKRQRKKKSGRSNPSEAELAQQQQMLTTLEHIIDQVRGQNAPQSTLVAAAPENSDVQRMVAAVQHGHRQVNELLDAASRADAPSTSGSGDVASSTSGTVVDRAESLVTVRPAKRTPPSHNEPTQAARKPSPFQRSDATSSTSAQCMRTPASAHPNSAAISSSNKHAAAVPARTSSDRNHPRAEHVSSATVNSGGIGIATPHGTSSMSTATVPGGASQPGTRVTVNTTDGGPSAAMASPVKREAIVNTHPARTSPTASSVQRTAAPSSSSSVATCPATTDPSSRESIRKLKERLAALVSSRSSSDTNLPPTDVARTPSRTLSSEIQPTITASSQTAVARTAARVSRTLSSEPQPSTSASRTARTSSDAILPPSAVAARAAASVSRTSSSEPQPSTSASTASTTAPPRRIAHSAAALSSQPMAHSSAPPAAERRIEQGHHKPSSSPSTFDRVGRAITDLSGSMRRPPTSDPRFSRLLLGAISPRDFEAAIYFLRARDAQSPLSEDEIGRCFVGMFKNAAAAGDVWTADFKLIVDLVKHP